MNKKKITLLYKKILSDKGKYKDSFVESDFGKYLIPVLCEILVPVNLRIGRVVQVREEIGQFGGDLVFLRSIDGTLTPWENQSFFEVKDEYIKMLNELFSEVNEWDDCDEGKKLGYNYPSNKNNLVGFIIPSPHKDDGYISPLKAIKSALKSKLQEKLNK